MPTGFMTLRHAHVGQIPKSLPVSRANFMYQWYPPMAPAMIDEYDLVPKDRTKCVIVCLSYLIAVEDIVGAEVLSTGGYETRETRF